MSKRLVTLAMATAGLLALEVWGCGSSPGGNTTPSPTPTIAPTPTSTPTATPTPVGTPPAGGSYLPLRTGDRWTYDVKVYNNMGNLVRTDSRVTLVETSEMVPGVTPATMGFNLDSVTTDASNGATKEKRDWDEDRGVLVTRLLERNYCASNGTTCVPGSLTGEAYYSPSKLIVDMQPDRLASGAVYYESYTLDTTVPSGTPTVTHLVTWTNQGTEPCTVGVASLTCLKLHRVSQDSTGVVNSDKTYWFAQGVGKVRELETGVQDEILTAYQIQP